MKKNLFTKILALFLAGAMLTGVGCKNYDNDIDTLNKRIDELVTGKIASLEQQVASMKTAISNLESAKSEIERKIQENAGDIDKLQQAKDALQQSIDQIKKDYVSNSELDVTLGSYASLEYIGKTYATLEKLGIYADGEAIKKAIEAAKTEAVNAAGQACKESFNTSFDAAVLLYMSSSSDNELKKAFESYNTQITSALTEAINNKAGEITADVAQQIKDAVKDIQPILERVAELEGRIQSLVYVPKSVLQSTSIPFESAPYITIGTKDISLGDKNQQTAVITFRVSPASVLSQITKDNLSIVMEQIELDTRAAAPAYTFTVKDFKVVDAKEGKFTVTAQTDYKFGSVEDETLAIALNVKLKPKSQSTQGIDYTSAFIPTVYEVSPKSINDNLVPAYLKGTEYVEITGDTYASELKYNSAAVVNFLEEVTVCYQDDASGKLSPLSAMWNNTFDISHAALSTEPVVTPGDKTNYTLTKTSVAIAAGKSNVALIDNVITSAKVALNLKVDGSAALKITDLKQTVKIIGENSDVNATTPAQFMWKYAVATNADAAAKNKYTAAAVALEHKLSGAVYKEIAGLAGDIKLYKGTALVSGIVPTLAFPSTPGDNVTTDQELVVATLTGNLKVSADYTIKAVYTLANKNNITIVVPVHVDGAPAIAEQTVSFTADYEGVADFAAVKEYAKALWNSAWAGKYFANQAEFNTAVYALAATVAEPTDPIVTLSKDVQNIKATFTTKAVNNTTYARSIKFENAELGLSVNFKLNLLFKLPAAALTPDITWNNGRPEIKATLVGAVYTTVERDLLAVCNYTGSIAAATVEFRITDAAAAKKASMDATKTKLNWGTWNKLELPMIVELKLDGYVLDSKPFTAVLSDPVKDAAITVDTKNNTIYASNDAPDQIKIAKLLTLKAIDGNGIFAAGETDGLNANLKKALCVNLASGIVPVKYVKFSASSDSKFVHFDDKTGVVSVEKIEGTVPTETITMTITVTYNYWFSKREASVVVLVKPISQKPAEPIEK